uniref:Uncharacterized protein n=1 Tax=Panagrellus redivivus TaxID=6233 RepID=A0A7E4VBV7_PANRE
MSNSPTTINQPWRVQHCLYWTLRARCFAPRPPSDTATMAQRVARSAASFCLSWPRDRPGRPERRATARVPPARP